MIAAAKSRRSLKVLIWPLLLLLGGFLLTWRLVILEENAEKQALRNNIRTELEIIRGILSRELYSALHLMEGVAGLIAIENGKITEEKFQIFISELLQRNRLIRNIAIAPDNIVRFVYPLDGNTDAIGLNYRELSNQWPGVQRMMEEGRLTVAGPVNLVQGGFGVIGRTPVYTWSKAEPFQKNYWGLVSTVLEFDALLGRTSLPSALEAFDVAMRGVDGTGATGAVFFGHASVFNQRPVTVSVPLPSGSWELAAIPRGGWPEFGWTSSTALMAGSTLSCVLALLLFSVLRAGEMRAEEIHQRRHAEERLRQLNQELELRVSERTKELELAKDAAQSADRLKSAFLATMSHELRTPLNSIIGFSGVLLKELPGPLNVEQKKQLRMVFESARHLLALISDVLDLSKIEAGQMKVHRQPMDLAASIQKAAESIRLEAAKKQLDLQIAPENATELVVSDPRRIEQILLNLLSNAVKFTEKGFIRVETKRFSRHVEVRVIDSGVGLEQESLGKLFQPFSQIDCGLDRKYEGTGLGLCTCKGLVELLGGNITVESTFQKGSIFRFTLPTEEALSEPADLS